MSSNSQVNKIRVKGVYYDLIRQVESIDSSTLISMGDDSSLMKSYTDENGENVFVASHSDAIKMYGENKTLSQQRKEDLINLIEKLGESGNLTSLGFVHTRYDGYKPIYNEEANTLTFEANTDTKYQVWVMPIKKGIIYRRTAGATINRTIYIAYTTTEITSGDDLLITTFDNVTKERSLQIFDTITIAPYDGYMLLYVYNQNWTNVTSYKLDLSRYKDAYNIINGEEKIGTDLGGGYIECDSSNANYGTFVKYGSGDYRGVTVDVSGASRIRFFSRTGSSSAAYRDHVGYIFYDDNDEVILSEVTCKSTETPFSEWMEISVPSNAKTFGHTQANTQPYNVFYLYSGKIWEEMNGLYDEVNNLGSDLTKYERQYDLNSQTYNALFNNLNYDNNFTSDGIISTATASLNTTFFNKDYKYDNVYFSWGIISGSSANYKVSYKYMRKSTVLKIYGQSSNATDRVVYIGMCTETPTMGSTVTNAFREFFPQANPNTLYYTVPFDGYVTMYYYNANWTSGSSPIITYTDEIGGGSSDNYSNLIRQAHYLNYTNTPSEGDAATLGLVHFSDFHEDSDAGNLLMNYVTKYRSYINDVVSTGDVVKNYLDNNSPKTYFNVDGLSNSLFVLGNHDQARNSKRYEYFWTNAKGELSTMEETIAASHEFSFNRYFVNADDDASATSYHQIWGVTLPNGYDDPTSPYYQSCYWYKDYQAQKIRLIGVDCMYRFDGIVEQDANGEFVRDENDMLKIAVGGEGLAKTTTEQETWIYDRMLDTINPQSSVNGYSIIMMSHYPLDDIVGSTVLVDKEITLSNGNKYTYTCNEGEGMIKNHFTGNNSCFSYNYMPNTSTFNDWFNMRNRIKDLSSTYGYKKGSFNLFGEMIDNFMNVDGSIERTKGKFIAWLCGHTHVDYFYYPKNYQNILNICINQTGNLRDQNLADRPSGSKERLCANYLAINTTSGSLKMVRLGLNMDRNLRPVNYTFYDYINRRIISEG